MQGTYRAERVVRDTPSSETSSPNMLVAWLGLAFVRWIKFCYFLTHARFINLFSSCACRCSFITSSFAYIHILGRGDIRVPI